MCILYRRDIVISFSISVGVQSFLHNHHVHVRLNLYISMLGVQMALVHVVNSVLPQHTLGILALYALGIDFSLMWEWGEDKTKAFEVHVVSDSIQDMPPNNTPYPCFGEDSGGVYLTRICHRFVIGCGG